MLSTPKNVHDVQYCLPDTKWYTAINCYHAVSNKLLCRIKIHTSCRETS